MQPVVAGRAQEQRRVDGGGEQAWRLSYSVTPEEMRSVAMPEPQHRIGPAGVSSGVSLRVLPSARVEDLTKICQHYEAKCSGVYASDSAAARYLFQLSREIQQVAASLEQERSSNSRASVEAEKLLKEWNESFGPDAPLLRDAPSLGVPLSSTGDFPAGLTKGVDGGRDANDASPDAEGISGRGGESSVSPGKVAEALRLLARRAVDAEEGTVEATREKASSIAGLRGALDAHVSVSAESSHADRLTHMSDRAAIIDEHEKIVKTMREQHDQALQQILVEKDVEHSKSCETFKKQLNEVQLELLNNRQHTINNEAQWRKRVEDLEQRESTELIRMRERFQEQLTRAKDEAAAAHAAMGVLGAPGKDDGRARAGGGGRGALGSAPGVDGGEGEVAGGMGEDSHKVRSLRLLLDESKKESRWVRERNQELERVVEALRKTIMRQAELASQRQDQQGQRPPTHAHRGRQHEQQQLQHNSGTPYGMGLARGGRGDAHQEPSAINHGNLNSSSTNNNHNSVGQRGGGGGAGGISAGDGSTKLMSRDDELLLARHRQTAGGLHANANAGGARGHDDAYLHHRHSAAGSRGGGGGAGVGVGARSGAAAAAAAAAGISRGGMSARSHLYQMQQQHSERLPYRRYTSHEAYDDVLGTAGTGASGGGVGPGAAGGGVRAGPSGYHPVHSSLNSRLRARDRVQGYGGGGMSNSHGGGGGGRGFPSGGRGGGAVYERDREMPDRSWSQSAPLPGNVPGNDPENIHGHGQYPGRTGSPSLAGASGHDGGIGAGMGGPGMGSQRGGTGGRSRFASDGVDVGVIGGGGGAVGDTTFAAPVPRHLREPGKNEGGGGGGGGVYHKNGGSPSVSAAASGLLMKGERAGGGVGGAARWDRDPVRDTMMFSTMKYPPGSFPPGGAYGEGAIFDQVPGVGVEGGGISRGAAGSRRGDADHKQVANPIGHGVLASGGRGGHRPRGGAVSNEASPIAAAMQGSPALSSSRGTPGPPPGLGDANPAFSPSSQQQQQQQQTGVSSRLARPGGGRGGRGGAGSSIRGGMSARGNERDTSDFDFDELDTAAVLGL